MKIITLLTLFLFLHTFLFGQTNLVINGGAEQGNASGWTIINRGQTGNQMSGPWVAKKRPETVPKPHSGEFLFTPGENVGVEYPAGTTFEIYQDIDVSSYASAIDLGTQNFSFSAWMSSLGEETPRDSARIILEYYSASGNLLAGGYNSGNTGVITYTQSISIQSATIGTRKIRIRLIGTYHSGDFINAYFDDISLTAIGALPIQLGNFEVQSRQNDVLATWQTENESNSDYFELQRSADGNSWSAAGSISAMGNSNATRSYSVVDENPALGQSFYRLRAVSLTGEESFSEIKSVKREKGLTLRAYPNPTANTLNITGSFETSAVNRVAILDVNGKNITPNVRVLESNNSKVRIDVSRLSTGVYFIRIGENTTSFIKK